MEKLKNILYTFVFVTTCVVFATATFITLFTDQMIFGVEVLWQILGVSFLCSMSSLIYQEQEVSKKKMKMLILVHYVFVNVIVLGCGILFGWFYPDNLPQVVGMFILIAIIYLVVSTIRWKQKEKVAELMNEKLREFQEQKNDVL